MDYNPGYTELAIAIIEQAVADCYQAGLNFRRGKLTYKIEGEQRWTTPLKMLTETMRWAGSPNFYRLAPGDPAELTHAMRKRLRGAYDGAERSEVRGT